LSTPTTEAQLIRSPVPSTDDALRNPVPLHCKAAREVADPGTTSTITTFSIVLDAEQMAKFVALSSWWVSLVLASVYSSHSRPEVTKVELLHEIDISLSRIAWLTQFVRSSPL
jgi:hypothetical protein